MAVDRHRNSRSSNKPSYSRKPTAGQSSEKAARFGDFTARTCTRLILKASATYGPAGEGYNAKDENVGTGDAKRIKDEYSRGVGADDADMKLDSKHKNLSYDSSFHSMPAEEGPPRKRHRMRIERQEGNQYLNNSTTAGSLGSTDLKTIDDTLSPYPKKGTAKSEPICINIMNVAEPSFASCSNLDQDRMNVSRAIKVDDVISQTGTPNVSKSVRGNLSESDIEQLTYYPSKPSNYDPMFGYDTPPMKIDDEGVNGLPPTIS